MTGTVTPLRGTMSESVLQANVLELAQWLGVRTVHFRPGLTKAGNWRTPVAGDGAGWPDLVLVGPRGALFRELKSAHEEPSDAQELWLRALHEAGLDARVWRPRDWVDGVIRRELGSIAGR